MRPFLAIAVWIVLIGGLSWYMQSRQEVSAVEVFQPQTVDADLSLEITPSFSVEPDPFALQTDEADAPAALLVKLNGKEIVRKAKDLPGGEKIVVENVKGIFDGENEFYVEANPPLSQASLSHAIRIRVLRGGETAAERTLWSEPGHKIATVFSLVVKPQEPEQEKDYDH